MDFPQPVCQSCAQAFTLSRVPYLLSCQHLLCSVCCVQLGDFCLVEDCHAQLDFQGMLPALDLLDVLTLLRQEVAKSPSEAAILAKPQTWASLNRAKLRCNFTLQGRTCQFDQNICPFSHEPLPYLERDTWLCECGERAIGYYCNRCQRFRPS